MMHYSVLIPQRDAADAIGRILPQLCQVLDDLLLPYEIICIDDASRGESVDRLEELLGRHAPLRVLRFDEPRGTGAALTAGLAAASGDLIIALDPRDAASPPYIPHLIARLSQHDLVVARHERPLRQEFWQNVARLPRLVWREAQLQPSEDLFFAARRQAVAGLTLARGAFRVLGSVVAGRGFRVCRLLLAEGLPPQGSAYRAGVVDRLAGRWLLRRYEPHRASEIGRAEEPRSDMAPARFDAARPRHVPQPMYLPIDKHSDDSG